MADAGVFQNNISKAKKCILTPREIEYLSLVGFGFRNKEIALTLTVSTSTVKKTLETIFLKIHAKGRANAVTIAFIHHIIDDAILDYISQKYNLQDFYHGNFD